MQTDQYSTSFSTLFSSTPVRQGLEKSVSLLKEMKNSRSRIFFIGNGGSNSICSHMMQDYAKIGGYRTFSFSDPSLITCFANDFGYENAIREWLKINFDAGDLLFALSCSGESKNILNAVDYANSSGGKVITLSAFEKNNSLSGKGRINFHVPEKNFGIAECFHQVILHIILDSLNEN